MGQLGHHVRPAGQCRPEAHHVDALTATPRRRWVVAGAAALVRSRSPEHTS